jgi:hypothetical protein
MAPAPELTNTPGLALQTADTLGNHKACPRVLGKTTGITRWPRGPSGDYRVYPMANPSLGVGGDIVRDNWGVRNVRAATHKQQPSQRMNSMPWADVGIAMGKAWEHMTESEKIEHLHADMRRTLRLFGQLRHAIMMEEQVTRSRLEQLAQRVATLEKNDQPQP